MSAHRQTRLRGAANPKADLDETQIRRIKESPLPGRVLARIYRVNDRRIKEIKARP